MVGGSGIVIVPGGSSLLSEGLPKPLSPTSSVSPSSIPVIIISPGLAFAFGVLLSPVQHSGVQCGEQWAGQPARHMPFATGDSCTAFPVQQLGRQSGEQVRGQEAMQLFSLPCC